MAEQTRSTQTDDQQESSAGGEDSSSSTTSTSEDGSSSGQAWAAEGSDEQTRNSQEPSEQESADLTSSDESASDQGSSSSEKSSSSGESSSSGQQESSQQDSSQDEHSRPARRSENHQRPEPAGGSDGDQGQQQESSEQSGGDGEAPHGREERAPTNVGEVVWRVASILATVVRVVGYLLAAVLVIDIVLTVVGVNTANGVAQVIGTVGGFAVLAFRDLFLLTDPIFTVVVNFGLAAVFWVLVAEFGSRLIRFLGARLS